MYLKTAADQMKEHDSHDMTSGPLAVRWQQSAEPEPYFQSMTEDKLVCFAFNVYLKAFVKYLRS